MILARITENFSVNPNAVVYVYQHNEDSPTEICFNGAAVVADEEGQQRVLAIPIDLPKDVVERRILGIDLGWESTVQFRHEHDEEEVVGSKEG